MINKTKVTITEKGKERKNCHGMVNSSAASLLLLHPFVSDMKRRNHFSNTVEYILNFSSVFRCLASPADQFLVRKVCLMGIHPLGRQFSGH